jgi:hypothetical protein
MHSLVRVIASVVGAAVVHTAWFVLVLSLRPGPPSPMPVWLIFTDPFATALGFGLGTLAGRRLTRRPPARFFQVSFWPLIGCMVGAVAAYPFGRMLTVLGVFPVGTAAVVVNELLERRRMRCADHAVGAAARCT